MRVDLGWLPLAFPNTKARVRAVKYHDLHHILTGYSTHWRGEAEIGAWEIGSNCRGFLAAWLLNLWAMWAGLCFAPRAIWQAFLRGRQSRNLYGMSLDDALLDRTVRATRIGLGLDHEPLPARPADRLAFAGASLLATLAVVAPFFVLIAGVSISAIWM